MAWAIQFTARAEKDFRKLGSGDRARVLRFLNDRVRPLADPRASGKALQAYFAGAWRCRVGEIRIIVPLEYDVLVVLVLEVGNRREVYR